MSARPDLIAEIAALRRRCEEQEAELEWFRSQAAPPLEMRIAIRRLGIQPWCAPVLNMLLLRKAVDRDTINDLAEPDWGGDRTGDKYCHVAIHRLRRGLRQHGIEIENIFGWGYRMSPEHKARLREILQQTEAAA